MNLRALATLHRGKSGMTLVELIVAMAVLVVIVVMIAQLVNSATATIANSGRHMDSDTEARMIFNRMATELAAMLKRPEVDYFPFKQPASTLPAPYAGISQTANLQPGNDQLAFYSETTGAFDNSNPPAGSQRSPISIVAYKIGYDTSIDPASTVPVLRRMSQGLGWEPESSSGGVPAWRNVAYLPITLRLQWGDLFDDRGAYQDDYKTAGYQVFRMEYAYLLRAAGSNPGKLSITPWDTTATPPHTSVDGFRDVAALVVAIVVLDSGSRVIVSDYSQLGALFPDAEEGRDIAASWNAVVNSPAFAARAKIPRTAAAGVRIYQRTFYLNTQP